MLNKKICSDQFLADHPDTVRKFAEGWLKGVDYIKENSGVLSASDQETRSLDYLSPHTSRQNVGRHWQIGPTEIEYLLKRYRKPVVDDEPARTGTRMYGGPTGESYPIDHIIQIYKMWQLGAYIIYHHDMFQTGYGRSAVPPNGIPDPEFSPYHKAVFEYIRMRDRFVPEWYGRR
jgi:hypothetical protein